jgi:competence protein ComEA
MAFNIENKNRLEQLIIFFLCFLFALFNLRPPFVMATELSCLSGVKIIDHVYNDGDSFHIDAQGRHLLVRLYFVDCPEISANSSVDIQRIKDQMSFFGLDDPKIIVESGNAAKQFVQNALSEPFTVYTAYASALGRSTAERIYAFVITSEGQDLSQLLVQEGLARVYGKGRGTPDGIAQKEMWSKLNDLQSVAMLKQTGIWSHTLPDRIVALRDLQRQEKKNLDQIKEDIAACKVANKGVINLNTAPKSELITIKGIGPVLAQKIIDGRPYRSLDEVLKVKGIGPKKIIEIRNNCVADE